MRAVSGPERIIHVQVTEARKRSGKRVVVLLFASREARVLEQQDLAVL